MVIPFKKPSLTQKQQRRPPMMIIVIIGGLIMDSIKDVNLVFFRVSARCPDRHSNRSTGGNACTLARVMVQTAGKE
jgi:hypothetical protein